MYRDNKNRSVAAKAATAKSNALWIQLSAVSAAAFLALLSYLSF